MAIRSKARWLSSHRRSDENGCRTLVAKQAGFPRRFPTRARPRSIAGRDCSRWRNRCRERRWAAVVQLASEFRRRRGGDSLLRVRCAGSRRADLRIKPLATRREMLRELISKLPATIRFTETFDASEAELIAAVRSNGLEGVVAKRRDSSYKPGDRSGAWVKVRANRGQELVIGGYIPGSTTFDSILVGNYEGRDLMYAARIRNGFAPASRRSVFSNFEGLSISKCPFRNLPESGKGGCCKGAHRRRHEAPSPSR